MSEPQAVPGLHFPVGLAADAVHSCTIAFTWPTPGAVIPSGRSLHPLWSVSKRIRSFIGDVELEEACGRLCVALGDDSPLCQLSEATGGFALDALLPGYHRLRLSWDGNDFGGAETWFHVSTATDLGHSTAARAHVIYVGPGSNSSTGVGYPLSICQFDDAQAIAAAFFERHKVESIIVASWRALSSERAQLPPANSGTLHTDRMAVNVLARHIKKELILQELQREEGAEAGSYFALQHMFEAAREKQFDEEALDMLLTSKIAKPDETLASALLEVLQGAVLKVPDFVMAAHTYLNIAWLLRNSGDAVAAAQSVEKAAHAAYKSLGLPEAVVRRRGDPRRPLGAVMLVTVATRSTPELERLNRSANAVGLNLIVDDGGGGGGKWLGFGSKIVAARRLLDGVSDNTLVLFTDAWDTLFLPTTPQDIKERFRAAGADIVFGAEVCCAPDFGLEALYPGHLAAEKAFLNSGTYMGRASDIRAMLDECLEDMRRQEDAHRVSLLRQDDQRVFTRYFLRHRGGATGYGDLAAYGGYGGEHIALDVKSALFLTLIYRSLSDVGLVFDQRHEVAQVRFVPTGTAPFLLHGNGDWGRPLLEELASQVGAAGWPPPTALGGESLEV